MHHSERNDHLPDRAVTGSGRSDGEQIQLVVVRFSEGGEIPVHGDGSAGVLDAEDALRERLVADLELDTVVERAGGATDVHVADDGHDKLDGDLDPLHGGLVLEDDLRGVRAHMCQILCSDFAEEE